MVYKFWNKIWVSKQILGPELTKNLVSLFTDIEALEKKSFKVCDEDEDGGLSWDEVDMCEVCNRIT